MKFAGRNAAFACGALLLLMVIYALLHPLLTAHDVAKLMVSLRPAPKYDLLFSIDFNEVPYANSNSTGMVIRVNNHIANAILTGKTSKYLEDDVPDVYVCQAVDGKLRKIHIPSWIPANKRQPGEVKYRSGSPLAIHAPELESLMIDTSDTAPDGYSLSFSRIDFNRPYPVLDLVMGFPAPIPILKPDAYEKCLAGC